MKNNKKKKGFTLIELIAVIAILGILAAVLVPNIIGYTRKAKVSRATSDAKVIINAFDAYNAEQDGAASALLDSADISASSVLVGPTLAIKVWPTAFSDASAKKAANLRIVANKDAFMETGTLTTGRWTINSSSGVVTVVP